MSTSTLIKKRFKKKKKLKKNLSALVSKKAVQEDSGPVPQVQVTLTQSKTVHSCGVMLMPGVNSVDRGVAEKLAAHSHIQGLIERNCIIIGDSPPTTKGRSIRESRKLISDTFDINLLDKYTYDDPRTAILEAVKDQKKLLEPTEEELKGKG